MTQPQLGFSAALAQKIGTPMGDVATMMSSHTRSAKCFSHAFLDCSMVDESAGVKWSRRVEGYLARPEGGSPVPNISMISGDSSDSLSTWSALSQARISLYIFSAG